MAEPDPRDRALAWLNTHAPAPTPIGFATQPWFLTPPVSPWFCAPIPGTWRSRPHRTQSRIVYAKTGTGPSPRRALCHSDRVRLWDALRSQDAAAAQFLGTLRGNSYIVVTSFERKGIDGLLGRTCLQTKRTLVPQSIFFAGGSRMNLLEKAGLQINSIGSWDARRNTAQEILKAFAGKRVLVVGDVMLDEYVWGRVSRVSPEAPVMVVDADRHTYVPGGAANVVNNLCALGAKAAIAGLIGKDGAGQTLTEKLTEEGADVSGLMTTETRPTTQKTRIIAHSQQVVRVDHERRDPISPEEQARLLAYLEAAIPACDALLLSDYQKGLLGRELIQRAVEPARAHGKVSTGNLKPQGIGAHCAPDGDHAQPERSERRGRA